MKKLWSGIRSIINVKNNRLNNISQIVQNGKVIKNPQDIAQAFNQYFVNIVHNIDKEIPRTRKCSLDYLAARTAESFFISPTDSSEIDSIISQLHKGKSVLLIC